jgi:hypothetical protein
MPIKATEYIAILTRRVHEYGDGDMAVIVHGVAMVADHTAVRTLGATGGVARVVESTAAEHAPILDQVATVENVVRTVGVLDRLWSFMTRRTKR